MLQSDWIGYVYKSARGAIKNEWRKNVAYSGEIQKHDDRGDGFIICWYNKLLWKVFKTNMWRQPLALTLPEAKQTHAIFVIIITASWTKLLTAH